jgi:hypothetical protein
VTNPFGRGVTIALAGIAGLSLVGAVLLAIFGGELGERPSAGADGYSRSAIGHAGLIAALERLGVPVVRSRHDSAVKARGGLLIIAEPIVDPGTPAHAEALAAMVADADRVLVVLPKWVGTQDPVRRTWIADADLLPVEEVAPVLAALDIEAEVRRPAEALPGLPAPQLLEGDVQTYAGRGAHSLIAAVDDAVWLVADPDLMNNHGLGRADNASTIIGLIEILRAGGPVVFDETLHGFRVETSPFRALFVPPLVFATLAALAAAALLLWAAMGRFGAPEPTAAAIAPGKDYLIRNTAALLRFGGHDAHALRRYLATAVAAVRQALHAPDLDDAALRAWLERLRADRGGAVPLAELERDVEALAATRRPPARRVLDTAARIHRWRKELTHGRPDDPRAG